MDDASIKLIVEEIRPLLAGRAAVAPEDLRQLTLSYWNFDQKPMTGLLVVNREVAEDVVAIFRDLFQHGFLIEKMTEKFFLLFARHVVPFIAKLLALFMRQIFPATEVFEQPLFFLWRHVLEFF